MSIMKSLTSKAVQQNGFTMVETLISMVVLSIGLLGLAGLQASSLRNNNSAYMRTQATILANDMLDRLRANAVGLSAGSYNSVNTMSASTPSDPNCITSGCTTAQIVQYDIWNWGQNVSTLLPSAGGTVVGNGANSVFTITVMWDDARTGATGTGCGTDETVDLKCLSMSSQL